MADPADVGGALTGQMDPAAAAGQWDDFLNRPGNRQALLQIGLGLMQPVGIGQTAGGHIAQAIGGGGEAVTRNDLMDIKEDDSDNKLAIANNRLAVAQQNADSNRMRADAAVAKSTQKKVGGLTDLVKTRFARQDERAYEQQLDRDAAALAKQAQDAEKDFLNPTRKDSPDIAPYVGKTKIQIRDMLRSSRPKPHSKYDDSTDGEGDAGTADSDPVVEAPPIPNARKAADGKWYAPDPKRPGKFLLVE